MGLVPAGLEFHSGTKTGALWNTAKWEILATSFSHFWIKRFIYLFIYARGSRGQFSSLGRQLSLCCLRWIVRATLRTQLALTPTWQARLEQGLWCSQDRNEQSWQLGTMLLRSLGSLFAVMKTGQAVSRLPSRISLCRLPVDTWLGDLRVCHGPGCLW